MQQLRNKPLCVDLDGTLVRTNTLFEAALAAIKKNPWFIVKLALSVSKGKPAIKHIIGIHAPHDASLLPYNNELLAWLKEQRTKGRILILATASDKAIADDIAQYLGIFQEVIASTSQHPVSANTKYAVLSKRFGKKEFSYAGNSHADLTVWQSASSAILVDTETSVGDQVRNSIPIEAEFSNTSKITPRVVMQTMRIHQWAKNLLLFTAPIAAHRIGESSIAVNSAIGFLSFSCLASSVYILNDLFDIASDRTHATKRFRPIAACKVGIPQAMSWSVLMAIVSILLATLFLPLKFLWILAVYFCITSIYSLRIKKIPYIDIVVLAALYVLRIIAGSTATTVPTSKWLFLFAGCLFISLAAVKRVTELAQLEKSSDRAIGRGYTKRDKELLTALGLTAALFSSVVLSLYTASAAVTTLYSRPTVLIGMILIFSVWIFRIWKHALTGLLPEDPVLFATKDYISYLTIAALFGIILLAL